MTTALSNLGDQVSQYPGSHLELDSQENNHIHGSGESGGRGGETGVDQSRLRMS